MSKILVQGKLLDEVYCDDCGEDLTLSDPDVPGLEHGLCERCAHDAGLALSPEFMDELRHVRLSGGYTLQTWDTGQRAEHGQKRLHYELRTPTGEILFQGSDFGCAPGDAIDSDQSLRSLLSFLTLKPGDTDRDYFAEYTPQQLEWCEGSDCESIACDHCIEPDDGNLPLPFDEIEK